MNESVFLIPSNATPRILMCFALIETCICCCVSQFFQLHNMRFVKCLLCDNSDILTTNPRLFFALPCAVKVSHSRSSEITDSWVISDKDETTPQTLSVLWVYTLLSPSTSHKLLLRLVWTTPFAFASMRCKNFGKDSIILCRCKCSRFHLPLLALKHKTTFIGFSYSPIV